MKKTFLIALVALSILGCAPVPKLVKVTMPFFIGASEEVESKSIDASIAENREDFDFLNYGPILTNLQDIYVEEGGAPQLKILGCTVDIVITEGEGFTSYRGVYPDNEGSFEVILRDDLTFTCEHEVVLTFGPSDLEYLNPFGPSDLNYLHQKIEGIRNAEGSYTASGYSFVYLKMRGPEKEEKYGLRKDFNIKCDIPQQKFAVKYKRTIPYYLENPPEVSYSNRDIEALFREIPYEFANRSGGKISECFGFEFRYYGSDSPYGGHGCYSPEDELRTLPDNPFQEWENF